MEKEAVEGDLSLVECRRTLGRLDVDDLELRLGPAAIDPDQVGVGAPEGDVLGQVQALAQGSTRLQDELEGVLLVSLTLEKRDGEHLREVVFADCRPEDRGISFQAGYDLALKLVPQLRPGWRHQVPQDGDRVAFLARQRLVPRLPRTAILKPGLDRRCAEGEGHMSRDLCSHPMFISAA